MYKKVLISGGGTGGHIYPAIAIANALKESSSQTEILFIGTKKGLEKKIVPDNSYQIKFIDAMYLYRSKKIKNFILPYKLLKSIFQAYKIIKRFKPEMIIGTGGYVCAPVLVAGKIAGIPVFIKEQDSFPGITTQMANLFADKTFLGFPDSIKHLKRKKRCVVTGNPIRTELNQPTKLEGKKAFDLDPDKKTIFVFGGSLGSLKINETIFKIIDKIDSDKIQILLQTGSLTYERFKSMSKGISEEKLKIMPYIDNIAMAYQAADLIICRAGAMTLSEISYCGKAAILIPYPYATNNHQLYNSKFFHNNKAGFYIEEKDLKPSYLLEIIYNILNSSNLLKSFEENSRSLNISISPNDFVKLLKK